jgi:hypothetical protein
MNTTEAIRRHLDTISASTATAVEALGDGAALDLPPSVLADLLLEVETLTGKLDLVLDGLALATDPVGLARKESTEIHALPCG